MNLSVLILSIISHWAAPVPFDEPAETFGEYSIRLETIADAASTVGDESNWSWGGRAAAAGVLTVWYAETRFDHYIHAGVPHPNPAMHEDHYRARCLGSLHRNRKMTFAEWFDLAGTTPEATLRCARATAHALGSSSWTCARGMGPTEHAMALTLEHYARGHCAEPSDESKHRARDWMLLQAKLWVPTTERTAGR